MHIRRRTDAPSRILCCVLQSCRVFMLVAIDAVDDLLLNTVAERPDRATNRPTPRWSCLGGREEPVVSETSFSKECTLGVPGGARMVKKEGKGTRRLRRQRMKSRTEKSAVAAPLSATLTFPFAHSSLANAALSVQEHTFQSQFTVHRQLRGLRG